MPTIQSHQTGEKGTAAVKTQRQQEAGSFQRTGKTHKLTVIDPIPSVPKLHPATLQFDHLKCSNSAGCAPVSTARVKQRQIGQRPSAVFVGPASPKSMCVDSSLDRRSRLQEMWFISTE